MALLCYARVSPKFSAARPGSLVRAEPAMPDFYALLGSWQEACHGRGT